MKHTWIITLLLLAASGVATAQEQTKPHAMSGMSGKHDMQAQTNTGVGRVNRVDLAQGKVNLTHGPIASLGWPGMTMDFKVRDKALLEVLKPGEMVEFDVVKQGPGEYYIVRIAPK